MSARYYESNTLLNICLGVDLEMVLTYRIRMRINCTPGGLYQGAIHACGRRGFTRAQVPAATGVVSAPRGVLHRRLMDKTAGGCLQRVRTPCTPTLAY